MSGVTPAEPLTFARDWQSFSSALSKLHPGVAELVKSFELPWEITESLDDFRYEPLGLRNPILIYSVRL
jgi:hypothetical protein